MTGAGIADSGKQPRSGKAECIASCVRAVEQRGSARLVVLGNLALLTGVWPRQLMVPNVVGMSRYADLGRMSTGHW
ncbi:MAG TPA: hypothetical protein VET27_25365 [Mycobacterium sp.]|nr:hypothetical protein [Mycobacterium sp.]